MGQLEGLGEWTFKDINKGPARPLECQANKCDGNSPPVLPSSNDSLYQMISSTQLSLVTFLHLQLIALQGVASWR